MAFCKAEQRFLVLFLEKEDYYQAICLEWTKIELGMVFREAELRFLLLFPEKEEHY
jgi:hypothetical protein